MEVLFAVANGPGIQAPGQKVDVFEHNGVDGIGLHLRGNRANESTIETWVDLLTADNVDAQKAIYTGLKGQLVTAYVGRMRPKIVAVLDVETDEGGIGGVSGGLNTETPPEFMLHAKWRVRYPYGR